MGENAPGGRKDRIPKAFRGDYMPESQIKRFNQPSEASPLTQPEPKDHELKNIDPSVFKLPTGTAISTGPYTQDGIYIIGAPNNSAFKFDETLPKVEGKLISRHGTLFLLDENGDLTQPSDQYLAMFRWATSRKRHPLLPSHFKGADSAKPLPNLAVEEWVIE